MLRALFLLAVTFAAGPALAAGDIDTCRDAAADPVVKHAQQPFTYGSPPGREDFYFVAGK